MHSGDISLSGDLPVEVKRRQNKEVGVYLCPRRRSCLQWLAAAGGVPRLHLPQPPLRKVRPRLRCPCRSTRGGPHSCFRLGAACAARVCSPVCVPAVLQIADFWKEAELLSSLHHPNVVAFYGVVKDKGKPVATVTEYMVNGSLKQVLQKKDR